MKRLKITVAGKVQGVFFRGSAREAARRLGLTGFARNQSDGTVYIEAEGEDAALDQFVEWCHRGPSWARVEAVVTAAASPAGYKSFEARF